MRNKIDFFVKFFDEKNDKNDNVLYFNKRNTIWNTITIDCFN